MPRQRGRRFSSRVLDALQNPHSAKRAQEDYSLECDGLLGLFCDLRRCSLQSAPERAARAVRGLSWFRGVSELQAQIEIQVGAPGRGNCSASAQPSPPRWSAREPASAAIGASSENFQMMAAGMSFLARRCRAISSISRRRWKRAPRAVRVIDPLGLPIPAEQLGGYCLGTERFGWQQRQKGNEKCDSNGI